MYLDLARTWKSNFLNYRTYSNVCPYRPDSMCNLLSQVWTHTLISQLTWRTLHALESILNYKQNFFSSPLSNWWFKFNKHNLHFNKWKSSSVKSHRGPFAPINSNSPLSSKQTLPKWHEDLTEGKSVFSRSSVMLLSLASFSEKVLTPGI